MEKGGALESVATDARRTRKMLVVYLAYLVAPLLLCVPILGLLRYDIHEREVANAVLGNKVTEIDAQIVDIKDLNKVRSRFLTRKQIVEQIDVDALQPVAALAILQRLPAGMQLLFLDSRLGRLALVVRYTTPSTELALIEQMAKSGFKDLRVTDRQSGAEGESLRIEATPPEMSP